FWSSIGSGVEEWLVIDRVDQPRVAEWTVSGAALRQSGERVDLLDGKGRARLSVFAPVAYTRSGARLRPRLQVEDGRIALYVDAPGESVLVDPAWAVRNTMSTIRYRHAATTLLDGRLLVTGGGN